MNFRSSFQASCHNIFKCTTVHDYRWSLDYWHNLLTTYITWLGTTSNYSTTAYLPIHKSPQHPLSLSSLLFSLAVPWQRLPTVEILQLPALRSFLHYLLYRIELPIQSQSQSYFMTGGYPPIISSSPQAPWDPWSVFFFQLNTCGYNDYETSSLAKGWVCCLQLLLAFTSVVILGFGPCGTYDHILLSQIWDSPNMGGYVFIFISPRNRMAQLYPWTLGSLFVTSYDSQGYSGGIRTCLHVGIPHRTVDYLLCRFYNPSSQNTQRTKFLHCCVCLLPLEPVYRAVA
jgi:hypothetical protein